MQHTTIKISESPQKRITPALYFAPKLKCFCHPDSLFSLPDPTEVCPRAPCLKKVDNLQQLVVLLQQKAADETAHIKELKN